MGSSTMDALIDFAGKHGCPDATMVDHLCRFLDHHNYNNDDLVEFLNADLESKGFSHLQETSGRIRNILSSYLDSASCGEEQFFEVLCRYSDQSINALDLLGFLEADTYF